jgi:rubredoxin
MTEPELDPPGDILDFLAEPAKPDLHDEIAAWTRFMQCPNCRAQYPDFHSPAGTTGTLCDNCGWSSDEDGAS